MGIIYNTVNRQGYLVGATPRTVLYPFFQIFTGVLIIVWKYACCSDIILRFFFSQINLAIFPALSITKWMDRGYLVGATPPTVLYQLFWNFIGVLVMVWKHACGLDIILRLFLSLFRKLNIVIFQALYITKWMDRDTLWAQLLLKFYTDSFKTSLMFWSCSENMHVVWI